MYALLTLLVILVLFLLYRLWLVWSWHYGAPYVVLDMDQVERVLELANVQEGDIVYDLGSGDGRIPIFASLKYQVKSVGIEIDLVRYLLSLFKSFTAGVGNKAKFLHRDFFSVNLSAASVVVAYLWQDTNNLLAEKLEQELKPGTRVVSAGFTFPDWEPVFVDYDFATPYGPLNLYIIGKSNTVRKESKVVNNQYLGK